MKHLSYILFRLPEKGKNVRLMISVMTFYMVFLQGMTPLQADPTMDKKAPLVIAHRGASGYVPEHTLEAFRLAAEQGADVLEPDLVMTRDGVLIVRHDIYLSSSTDIADRSDYADRKRTIDGHTDWFVFDFTLAEIKTLKARQVRSGRDTSHDGKYDVITFDEFLDFVEARKNTGKVFSIAPEIKYPSRQEALGLPVSETLYRSLERARGAAIPVYLQSFDLPYLRDFPLIEGVHKIALLEHRPTHFTYADIAAFSDGFGVYKKLIYAEEGTVSADLQAMRDSGNMIILWTFRDDDVALPFTSIESELRYYYRLNVDAVFTDFPDTALRVRKEDFGE